MLLVLFEIGYSYVAQAHLKNIIFLSEFPEGSYYRHIPPYPSSCVLLHAYVCVCVW